ncbi:putative sodium-coupled neutral amino acid transporter 11 [Willisornis vidua]|uniref:Putative sodium-coupled neutral amino acid transporter 11 n=1 Tax=Willisornis vidua TaxID=1566151 RepID=A0ABQ9CMB2_9PASS|nr:putative sodium-coupled neutral amino acid transporter 11 [Willisornis vidua]
MEPSAAAAAQVETDDQIALLSKPRKKGGNSDLASAAFNIVNSIIGSGVIGLPYSMKEAGFPLGVLLLFVVAYITDYSIILLIKGGNLSNTKTYQDLVRKTYGRVGYIILSTLQFLYPFIAMISYNIITGDTLTKVFQRIPGGDIFENYCRDDNFATFGRFCYGVTVILTFPLECFVTREVVANVFFHGNLSTAFHVVVTVVIVAVATGVSLVYDCLGIVLELNDLTKVMVLQAEVYCAEKRRECWEQQYPQRQMPVVTELHRVHVEGEQQSLTSACWQNFHIKSW